MGSDLVEEFDIARTIFDRATEVLGYDMAELCFEDPRGELDKTRFTQPALLTHEVACLEVFRSLIDADAQPLMTAGHSLGEYSALVCAGALRFEAALALVAERGRLMSEFGGGSMLATTLDVQAATVLADKHYCAISACNLPEQTVIAGEAEDLEVLAADLSEKHPRKRAIALNAEGAFHTYFMVHAAQKFRETLEATNFERLEVDALSNYTGGLHMDEADAIRSRLFFQFFNPVLWIDCMTFAMDAGIDCVIEFGGGIGKGEGPEGKRANLESIIKKSLKWRQHDAQYVPAINAAGIRAAARQLS